MDRKIAPHTVLITPASSGWTVAHHGTVVQTVGTLEAAAEFAPEGEGIHLALPANMVIVERMTLPSSDRAELQGMVNLQLEKSLPYAPEEVTSDFLLAKPGADESTVLAIAIHNDQLEELCRPLHTEDRVPEKITMFAMHVAAGCPADQLTLAIYCELEKFVVVISDHGMLSFVETVEVEKADEVLAALPHILLSAELDGVPTAFTALRVDDTCAAPLRPDLEKLFSIPCQTMVLDPELPEPESNLLPPVWQRERAGIVRQQRFKAQLITGAIVYLAIVVAAFGYLMWMRHSAKKLDAQVRAGQPQIEFIRTRLARWNALAPAINPGRYTVELLNQLEKCRPAEGLRFTLFDQSKEQMLLEIEAPSANLAIDFGEQLKKNDGLKEFTFEINPPAILPNEHAQMRIVGKL